MGLGIGLGLGLGLGLKVRVRVRVRVGVRVRVRLRARARVSRAHGCSSGASMASRVKPGWRARKASTRASHSPSSGVHTE